MANTADNPLELWPSDLCFRYGDCLYPSFRKVRNTGDAIVMYHFPTKAAFAIVYDPDQAMVYHGQTIYGFAARIWRVFDEALLPTDSDQLEAIGQEAIMAWFHHLRPGVRYLNIERGMCAGEAVIPAIKPI